MATSIGRDLFPDIGPVTAAVLFHGLAGAPVVPADPAAWEAEVSVLTAQRLSGLALAAAKTAGVDLAPETLAALRSSHGIYSAVSMRVESFAPAVSELLASNSIQHVVTKGAGIAREYPDVSFRTFVDLDVLVAPAAFDKALALLRTIGFNEPELAPEPRDYFIRRCREAINLVREDGASVDLHHHVPPWVWGSRLPLGRVTARAKPVALDRGTIPVPDPVHNLLIASMHVISDKNKAGMSLLVWRDVIQLAAHCDPADVAREAMAFELDWLVSLILRSLPLAVQPTLLLDALGNAAPKGVDAWRLRRLLPPGIGSRTLAPAFRLPLPNALAYLAGYALPSKRFLLSRYGRPVTVARWWRDSVSQVSGHDRSNRSDLAD